MFVCVSVCLSACPSKFGVCAGESVKIRSLRERSKVDRFPAAKVRGEEWLCYTWVVSLPFAWRPSRISSATSRRPSPSPASLWYHPPTVFQAKEPRANTNCQEKYQLGREGLANVT